MVKVRMNTADVAAEVKCLRRLIGMRCSNVYDLTPKTYMFKLMNSSGVTESGESEKVLLLMESGVRLHTTAYARDKSNTPSGFTLKLRKHIRTRRLEDVRQLGYDRIILFQFGLGANAHYVILELYAQGNIILTDNEFTVLTLLRSHRDDDKGLAIMSRHRYPVEMCRVFERTSIVKLKDSLTVLKEPSENEPIEANENGNNKHDDKKGKQGGKKSGKASGTGNTSNDGARNKQSTLKMILGEALGYGPQLSEHIILDAGMVPSTKIAKDSILDDEKFQSLAQAVARFEDWLEDVITGSRIPEGYILMQNKKSGEKDNELKEQGISRQMYDDYCPILMVQLKSREFVKYDTFDAALDEFYSKIESQRVEQQQKAKEGAAVQKLNKIRNDQENRVHVLKKEVEYSVRMAQLIEYNLEDVNAAIMAVRVALANGMSWEDLARMVKEEKKSGNPVAGLIEKLYLDRNCMTLLLSNNLDEMNDEEKTLPADKVEVDISLSAHANARRWYEMKKKQESKQEKTVTAHEKAFKAAEKKTRLQLSQEKSVAMITHMRKVHWFEKFNWFISSENYLIVSGRDAQQNEMIVKRYMSKGDIYVHAELHGASSTVIKNHKPDSPVPPLTLNQAGVFTVCHSQAWDSKIVTSAWWVYPHQVSKTAPTGEYLTVGSFMIRGKKNFLPPHPLIMGFGLLFRLDESSLGSHLNERRVRGEEDGLNNLENDFLKEESDSTSDEKAREDKPVEEFQGSPGSPPGNSMEFSESSNMSVAQNILNVEPKQIEKLQIEDKVISTGVETKDKPEERDVASVNPQLEDLMDRALGLGPATTTTRGYEQDVSSSPSEKGNSQESINMREKPYISKADRRKLKKGQKSNSADVDVHVKEEKQHIPSVNQSGQKNSMMGGGKATRGQKGKLKKMKEKYADQDEEERKIRMALLASAGKPNMTENIVQDQDATIGEEKKPVNGLEDAPKICYKCKKVGHLSRECPEQPDATTESNANDGRQRKQHRDANHAAEADKVDMEEEDIHEIGEEEKEKLNDVDYLTGNPLPNDILLYAVPVCGPYNAVQSYKYRVKIIPGTAKKGKAAKSAMNLFGHMPEASNREKELMKACTDPELVAAMIGNVKITAAGLAQLKQKQKKGKKTGGKGTS